MHPTADTAAQRENVIKRVNASILNFVKRIRLRSAGATLLGACAGLSLTANIIPSVLSYTGVTDSFSARWQLGGYAVYSMMVWGVGGRAAQKAGSKGLGAIILGTVGLASGLLLTAAGIGTQLQTLLYGGGAALVYGAIGGMIIGDALREPSPSSQGAPTNGNGGKGHAVPKRHRGPRTEQESVRLFRFFR